MNTPILIISYNRPDQIRRLITQLNHLKCSDIFIFSDGPKNKEDEIKINQVREEFKKLKVNYKTLFLKQNLGCQNGVESAINWIFKHRDIAIILEDDIDADESFFKYSSILLKKYQNNNRIGMISGNNLVNYSAKESYFFSNYPAIWGWATWAKSWENYNKTKLLLKKYKSSKKIKSLLDNKIPQSTLNLALQAESKKIDTWDYIWKASLYLYNQLSITPSANLVSNRGFGENATHTKFKTRFAFLKKTQMSFPMNHPNKIKLNSTYENEIIKNQNKFSLIYDLIKYNIKPKLNILKNLFYLLSTVKNFWLVLLLRLGFKLKKDKINLNLRHGGKIKIRTNNTDFHEVISVLSGKDYPLNKFKKNINLSPTIIDVGAFIGDFILFSKQIFPNSKIIAIEPHPESFELLKENIDQNNLKNVKIENIAVSNKNGSCFFSKNDNANESRISRKDSGYSINSTTLDSIINKEKIKKIDILKMDCEGCEYQIIKKFPKIEIENIIMEYHLLEDHNEDELFNFFKKMGYKNIYSIEHLSLNSGIVWFKK